MIDCWNCKHLEYAGWNNDGTMWCGLNKNVFEKDCEYYEKKGG